MQLRLRSRSCDLIAHFTVRNLMGVVAITAVLFGGVAGMNEVDSASDHLRKQAECHRWSEESFEAEAASLECLAAIH